MTEQANQPSLEDVVEEVLRLRDQDQLVFIQREEKRVSDYQALVRRIEALEVRWYTRLHRLFSRHHSI